MENVIGGQKDCLQLFMDSAEAYSNAAEAGYGTTGYYMWMGVMGAIDVEMANQGCFQ
ncbi:MAG: hypothetical protein JSS79_10305 [Bacteroidetes bacterium]|nr:hypothetical protein [Bacteroidota bacterium]